MMSLPPCARRQDLRAAQIRATSRRCRSRGPSFHRRPGRLVLRRWPFAAQYENASRVFARLAYPGPPSACVASSGTGASATDAAGRTPKSASRFAVRPLAISCLLGITFLIAPHSTPPLRISLLHIAHDLHIKCQEITRSMFEPPKVGAPDGFSGASGRGARSECPPLTIHRGRRSVEGQMGKRRRRWSGPCLRGAVIGRALRYALNAPPCRRMFALWAGPMTKNKN